MKQKKKLWAIALVIILLALLAGNSIAYYSVIGTATNVVTSGNIRLKIIETGADNNAFPKDGVAVIPGQTVTKRVTVQNICTHPFWLRLEVTTGSSNSELKPEDVMQILDLNTQDWTEHEGYYYYNTVLKPLETTKPLFSQVKFIGENIDTDDIGSALTITVLASAVQSENNEAKYPWKASGWPES